jgi:hypothetical protein
MRALLAKKLVMEPLRTIPGNALQQRASQSLFDICLVRRSFSAAVIRGSAE